jgi:putative DNA primase/helicase
MNLCNLDDAKAQLQAAGLILDGAVIPDGRFQRWRVEGRDRERRGWSRLREWIAADGNGYVVGAFGIWHGNDDGRQRIVLPKRGSASSLSREDIAALRAAQKEAERRLMEARKREAATAARWAQALWACCAPCIEHEYLTRKGIGAHGARVVGTLDGLQLDGVDTTLVLQARQCDSIAALETALGRPASLAEVNCWRLTQAEGALVVPIHDGRGTVLGLQFIYPAQHPRRRRIERDKEFWPSGMSVGGNFGLIGPLRRRGVLLLAEGFATAATLHEATGLTTAYAFSANNLRKAAQSLRRAAPDARLLICADDDYLTEGNPGKTAAAEACAAVEGAAWIVPDFTAQGDDLRAGRKLSDFNDLAQLATPTTVAAQVHAQLDALGWRERHEAVSGGAPNGREQAMPPRLTVDEAAARFWLTYGLGGKALFDELERRIVHKDEVLNLLPRHGWDELKQHPGLRIARSQEIGFDPTEADPRIRCNLFGPGWPTTPKPGCCDRLLELLRHMVGNEPNAAEVYDWLLKWLAYPLQHPGAKMHSAVVVHGPQGTGKSRFFEAYGKIYGRHFVVLDQSALEDRFNSDWAESKLFVLADEVLARPDLFHTKNKLKGFITGEWIRVNPKNVAAHVERNHMNLVFLSNERQPLILEHDDRRHLVMWTPPPPDREFFEELDAEIEAGGIAALHHHLLNLDLGDFKPHTRPPMTEAKRELIELGRSSEERFGREWQSWELTTDDGELVPFCPCRGSTLYRVYTQWCRRVGELRPRSMAQFVNHFGRMPGWTAGAPRKIYAGLRPEDRATLLRSVKLVVPSETALNASAKLAPAGVRVFVRAPQQSVTEWLTECYFAFELAAGQS